MNARELFNRWVILGALVLAGLLLLITAITIGLTSARRDRGCRRNIGDRFKTSTAFRPNTHNDGAPSESPNVQIDTPMRTRSFSKNWPGIPERTGNPRACVATTVGVVNRKLMVPTNRTTASALPAADARGHHGRTAISTAAMISNVPRLRATAVALR